MKRQLAWIAAGALVILSGCSTSPSEPASQPAPIIATPEELAGTTVEITTDRPLVVDVPDAPSEWSGYVEDPGVAVFVKGATEGDTEFNPGFSAIATGETAVVLSAPNGEETFFSIRVE